ncbi:hypothetical protein EVAR_34339_1 [Eumeta japonica]|uniref:Uncharacterized protein n=1 Tax=Eumeta variegata TaxID=151549 RepID=A0A4C1VCT7_EUMVA|nr:hypothetical protein EVAR_34339_1 [Eumeta japonica]
MRKPDEGYLRYNIYKSYYLLHIKHTLESDKIAISRKKTFSRGNRPQYDSTTSSLTKQSRRVRAPAPAAAQGRDRPTASHNYAAALRETPDATQRTRVAAGHSPRFNFQLLASHCNE